MLWVLCEFLIILSSHEKSDMSLGRLISYPKTIISWFITHKCTCDSLESILTAPIMVLKSRMQHSYLVSTTNNTQCPASFSVFASNVSLFWRSVIWLWLGSMWWLWPFLTLARWCCDQLWGRLSVSHWALFFKWQAWKCCQHIPFYGNVLYV